MNLDGNKRIELADYAYDEQSGKETYDIDFDKDTIIRHEKGRQFKLNEMSKIPLGAAYSLMRFHGAGVPATVSDCEYDEYNDMILKSRTAVLLYIATMSISRCI